ncbi:MAG: glucuronoarabinoxylan endo-1,4-beta-xylanase, partial [Oscillospiraceae bacterium]|nr:glucuronoarabinoxylan endo-1,4-beta-xylanase [Oscillospiraceae bacterium]
MSVIMPEDIADAASACTINTNKTYQIIQGFGGINHREWTGYDLTDAEVQRAFGTGDNELGMSILRIFVNDNSSQWNLAIPVAKKAQALGATVFASPWCPPASIRSNGTG